MKSHPMLLLLSPTSHRMPPPALSSVALRTPFWLGKSLNIPAFVAGHTLVLASNRTEKVVPSTDVRMRLPANEMYFHERVTAFVGLLAIVVTMMGNACSPPIVVGAPSFSTNVAESSNEADPVLPE